MASYQINIRVSDEERAHVMALAAAAGLPVATWVKAKLLSSINADATLIRLDDIRAQQVRFEEHLLSRVNAILQATFEEIPASEKALDDKEKDLRQERIKELIGKGRAAAERFVEENSRGE
jgi:hypothetical protein